MRGENKMFKLEENKKIGVHLSKLIDEKFDSKRQFCIAYIKADGRIINNVKNHFMLIFNR